MRNPDTGSARVYKPLDDAQMNIPDAKLPLPVGESWVAPNNRQHCHSAMAVFRSPRATTFITLPGEL